MELINDTDLPAKLGHGFVGKGEKLGWVYARATYGLDLGTGALTPDPEPWPLHAQPLATDIGTFPPCRAAVRRACDVVVVMTARPARPTRRMTGSVSTESWEQGIMIVGDRTWERHDGQLVPSEPLAFESMPMDWSRAFGGVGKMEDIAAPHLLNPQGRGYATKEEDAEGLSLPNLEDPAAPIQRWDDAPLPLSWAPIEHAMPWHMSRWVLDEEPKEMPAPRELTKLVASWEDGAACPQMIAPCPSPGERVTITLGEQVVGFRLPTDQLVLASEVGSNRQAGPLRIVSVWALVDQQRVVVTYFRKFRYAFEPRESRVAVLTKKEA